MANAKHGDTVIVHYTASLTDGTVFDSSWDAGPVKFTIGEGTVIKGFESAVVGMSVGETKKVIISSDDAYGAYSEELIITVNRSMFPQHIEPIEGLILELHDPGRGNVQAIVVKITEESVTLDANHPLAGKDLTFEIDLLEIVS
jgi:peptidylprolyl isomerase